jgi:hypothetical protein
MTPPIITKEEAQNLFVLLTRVTTITFAEVETVAALKAKLLAIANFVDAPPTPPETVV